MKKLLLLFILISTTAMAQWPIGGGKTYAKLGVWQQSSDTHFTDTGTSDPNGLREYFIPGLYIRTGLNDKWTMTGYIPVVHTSQALQNVNGHYTDSDTNIGDVNVSLERLLYRKNKFVLSADLTLGIPSGVVGVVGSGDGEFNQQLRLLAGGGYKIFNRSYYLKGYAGFNNRTEGFSDELRAGIETGTKRGKFLLLTRLSTIQSLKNKPRLPVGSNAVFGDRIERTVIGSEVNFELSKKIGLSVGYNRFLQGEYVFNAPSWVYGITFKN